MSLWQQYGHLWPQALIVSLTVTNICWNLTILFYQARAARSKPLAEMATSLTMSLVSAAIYLSLDAQRIAAVLRPSLARAKIAYYLWIAERVFGATIFAGFVALSINDLEARKKVEEAKKGRDPVPLWRILLLFTPFLLGFALWKMNRNLARQEQQRRQQEQQRDAAQNTNAAGAQQRQQTRMRLWPVVFEGLCAANTFVDICYHFATMTLPVSYLVVAFCLFTLYIQAFGLMALYRRSIPSVRLYSSLIIISAVLDIAWLVLDPPIQNSLPTPEQESQILNLDLNSILSAQPTDTARITDSLFAEFGMAEYIMGTMLTVAFEIWVCRKIVEDLEKLEAEKQALDEEQVRIRAQAQTQSQSQAQAHSQIQEAPMHATAIGQKAHEKQD